MTGIVDVVIPARNAAATVCDTVRHIHAQELPDDWQLCITVCDDASTDDTAERLAGLRATVPTLQVVRSDVNLGRSGACNLGVGAGAGAVVVICDADCRYTRDNAIAEFLAELGRGADVAIGLVETQGDGFWARYTNSVTAGRIASETTAGLVALTTANIALRRPAFERLQGFSQAYASYGFEDKDLLIRLERSDLKTVVRDDIRVSHDDDLSLAAVCGKALESGAHSGPVFRSRFPDAYRTLPYSRCDVTTARRLRFLKPLAGPLQHLARLLAATALILPAPFFRLQRFAVRVAVCAAYFRGTCR